MLGVLDVALDFEPVDAEVQRAKQRVAVTTVVEVLLITALLAAFVAAFVTRPIHRLIGATAAVSRMELDQPIDHRLDPRAVDELVDSFNGMRERLREAVAEINDGAQELEAKVAERTAQLKARPSGACCRPTAWLRWASWPPAWRTRSTTRSRECSTSRC